MVSEGGRHASRIGRESVLQYSLFSFAEFSGVTRLLWYRAVVIVD